MFGVSARWAQRFVFAVSALVWGCGEAPQPSEAVGSLSEPVTDGYSPPVATAISVRGISGRTETWLFACTDTNELVRLVYMPDGGGWSGPDVLDWWCDSVPSVNKFAKTDTDQLFLYLRDTNDLLWELDYRDTRREDTPSSWQLISDLSGIGEITGSPVIAGVRAQTGEVSVITARKSDGCMHSVDFTGGSWHRRKVLFNSGSCVTTSGYVTTHPPNGQYIGVSGRVLTRPELDFTTNYRPAAIPWTASLVSVTTASGRLFSTMTNTRYQRRLHTTLVGDTSWRESSCNVDGYPMAALGSNVVAFVRAADGQLASFFLNQMSCPLLGGKLYSMPITDDIGRFVFYKGADNRLYEYNRSLGAHFNLHVRLP